MNRRNKFFFFVLFFLFASGAIHASTRGDTVGIHERLTVEAFRVTIPIVVDGILSDQDWQRPGITNFTQRDPVEGVAPTEKTEVWIAYDDEALYVAARMYDSHPDSIVARIGRRDADMNSDWFYLAVDSYLDRQTAFYFGVNPGGSIQDGTFFNDEQNDNSWDGVWDVAATIDEQGWTAEFRMPYTQLRFSEKSEYIWGINFLREIGRRNEEDFFVMVPKKESGFVSRFADLIGIRDIHPPRRLEILPYVASSEKFQPKEAGNPFNTGSTFSGNLGGDVKLGLGSNLTLNATINPDFGQVEVDPAVVNLSQFEIFYDEKRPFFIEGTNFFRFGRGGVNNNWGFNWDNPNFFYSRRIGRAPQGDVQHDGFNDIPSRTTIIGAAKITGKISEGWSLATLQAFTAREYGKVDSSGVRFRDVVEPFTSYSVVRTLREFNNGKQGLGMNGMATVRDLNQSYLVDNFNRRAFTFGVDGWTNLDADQMWVVSGMVATSRVNGTANRILSLQTSELHYFQRPDADHVQIDSNATSLSGYTGRIALNKQKGNVQFNAAVGLISPGFNSNDLGYVFNTDVINAHVVTGYQWFNPEGIFRNKSINIATYRNYNFGGKKFSEGYFLFFNGQFTNYWHMNNTFTFHPGDTDNGVITRGGPRMATTNFYGGNLNISTDSRLPVVGDAGVFGGRSESGGYVLELNAGIEVKPSSNVKVSFSPRFTRDVTVAQWIDKFNDSTATNTYGTRYVFGKIDQQQISGSIRLDWTFSPKLSLQMYLQPLIAVGHYNDFKELKQPGTYSFNRYGQDNSSTISHADNDYYLFPNPLDLTDSISVSKDDYVVDADGAGASLPFKISNPDFNFKSLRGNAVLRWEYMPGSTIYFVWTQQRTNEDDAGNLEFWRDVRHVISARGENVFLVKVSYWWNP